MNQGRAGLPPLPQSNTSIAKDGGECNEVVDKRVCG
nr:MAG TPA: hypothetical protein [Caudoviricetes sp.]